MVDTPEPDADMSFLLSITGNVCTILGQALREITLSPTDTGVAALAIRYANEIDKGNMATLAKFGPLLLQTMESLQMSPRSRAQSSKGVVTNVKPASKLDELRSKRIERANRTQNLDAATS